MTIKYLTKKGKHSYPQFHLDFLNQPNHNKFMIKQSPWNIFPSLKGKKEYICIDLYAKNTPYVWKPSHKIKIDIKDILFNHKFPKKSNQLIFPKVPKLTPVPTVVQEPPAVANNSNITHVNTPVTGLLFASVVLGLIAYKLLDRKIKTQ
jgi:hypothetical protein